MNEKLAHKELSCDFCVVGGGLSGCFAALAAARHGAKVILMQDRPMLGGNASSEIRMWVRGAKGKFDRETGLISELEERNIAKNPTLVPSLFDATLYDMMRENPNITLVLNCSCADAETQNGRVVSVTGWQLTTYTWITIRAKYFADCSGDSILAPLVGATYRHGREAVAETGEQLAHPEADSMTMGMSVFLCARETDKPVRFTPPSFANVYPDDDSFAGDKIAGQYQQSRDHHIGTSGCNLWWIELGGDMHSIYDAEQVRDELLACVYGVWDHLKNRGDHGMDNWELEFVGFLPGKRESRRYEGAYILTEQDVLAGGNFEDEVAFGGWPLDDHNPHGMRRVGEPQAPSVCLPTPIYGIPYRSLYSHELENLFFAGRNLSATHAALSSTRVMATCSLLGQAMGTAAGMAVTKGCSPRDISDKYIRELQKNLQQDGVYLPHTKNTYHAALLSAETNLTPAERETLFNGIERPRNAVGENAVTQKVGDVMRFTFKEPTAIAGLRIRFDLDFGHESVSPNRKMRIFAMKINTGKDFEPVKTAATIVKGFVLRADGKEIYRTEDNFYSHVQIPLGITAKELELEWLSTHGAKDVRIFGLDLLDN